MRNYETIDALRPARVTASMPIRPMALTDHMPKVFLIDDNAVKFEKTYLSFHHSKRIWLTSIAAVTFIARINA